MSKEKLRLEDLKVGMRVTKEQLEDIYGVWIYFDHYDNELGGTIIYIGQGSTNESREAVRKNNGVLSTFYQDLDYIDEEVIICE